MDINETMGKFFNLEEVIVDYDVNNYNLGELKSFENDVCRYTSQMLYYTIKAAPSFEMIEREMAIIEPISFADFKNNLLKVQNAANEYIKAATSVKKIFKEDFNSELKSSGLVVAYYKPLVGFIDVALPYYNLMQKIAKVRDNEQDKRLYLSAVAGLNKKVVKQLKDIVEFANKQESWAIGKTDQLTIIASTFEEITKDFHGKNLPAEEPKQKIEGRKVVLSGMSESEKMRLQAIKDANNLFDELCLDFMRDLEKQYSLSSKDLYEKFLHKFEKFTNQFEMPLSNDVSTGFAFECIMQIRKLMDMVSDISENSYVTSIYQK